MTFVLFMVTNWFITDVSCQLGVHHSKGDNSVSQELYDSCNVWPYVCAITCKRIGLASVLSSFFHHNAVFLSNAWEIRIWYNLYSSSGFIFAPLATQNSAVFRCFPGGQRKCMCVYSSNNYSRCIIHAFNGVSNVILAMYGAPNLDLKVCETKSYSKEMMMNDLLVSGSREYKLN